LLDGAALGEMAGIQQAIQKRGGALRIKSAGGQRFGHAEAFESGGVVGLVVAHGHDELGDSGGHGLGAGADAAVVDDGAAAGEHAAKGGELDVKNVGGEILRNVLAMARQE
jgi:hypothetical protein